MDSFFFPDDLQADIYWSEGIPVNQSAFVPYIRRPRIEFGVDGSIRSGSDCRNMNKKMMEFLKRGWPSVAMETPEPENNRKCFRHMMNERLRRERESKCYSSLHSLLPPGTKNHKTSIVNMAVKSIEEMQRKREVLQKRNYEIEMNLGNFPSMEGEKGGRAKISFRVENPTSGVDSMVEVLKCLKKLGTNPVSIQSKFSDQELLALMDIETEIGADEVQHAVQSTLEDAERKLPSHFPETYRS